MISSVHRGENEDNAHFIKNPPIFLPICTGSLSQIGRQSLIFNMLILVGAVKMADRVVREMMGL